MKINSNYYWKEEEFLTGDNIEQLGDFIFDIENFLIGDHGRTKLDIPENILIENQIKSINEKEPKTIYCYGHDTKRFLLHLDKIKQPFKLITHNSDVGILEEFLPFLNDRKIIKWFGQNNALNHPKTVSIPIAIARKEYPHGNLAVISECTKNNTKEFLVYKNFIAATNITERTMVDRITAENGIPASSFTTFPAYLNTLSKSIFTISPPGNGIDCHRIWESLYLKTIPIVKYHHQLEAFKDFPILFIDDWNKITIDFLKSNVNKINVFENKLSKLSFNYWKDLIQEL
jgi:hypothetical protein